MALTGGKNRTLRPIAFDSGIVNIGDTATIGTGTNSTVVGSFATSIGNESLALGYLSYCGGLRSIAIGGDASDSGFDHSVILGSNATSLGIYGLALGVNTLALANAIALGRGAVTGNPNELAVGSLIAPIVKADFPGIATLVFHTSIGIEFTHDASTDGGPTAFTMTGGTYIDTAGTRDNLRVTATFAPLAGNANFNTLDLDYVVDQQGVSSGMITGLLVKGTETAVLGRHELVRVQNATLVQFKVYGSATGGGIGARSIRTNKIYAGSFTGTEQGGTSTQNNNLDLVAAGGTTTIGIRLQSDLHYNCSVGATIHTYVNANFVTSSATASDFCLSRFDYMINQTDPGNTGTVIGIGLQARETAIVGKHYLMDLATRVGLVVTSKFRVTNTAEIQLSNGGTVVSDVDTGKLAYQTGTQQFYVSMNNAAYVPLLYAPAGGGFTSNYVPFGGPTGALIESSNLQFDPTGKILSVSNSVIVTNAAVAYTTGSASVSINRTGNLTGLVGENVSDLKFAPTFTLTTPGAFPMFAYNGANIDLTGVSVSGFYGELAAMRLVACPDGDADGYSYAMHATGLVGMFRGITGTNLIASYGGISSWNSQIDADVYLGSISLNLGNVAWVGATKWAKSRSTNGNTAAIVLNNDYIASLEFDADDGNDIKTTAARMEVRVDGAPALNSIPGRFVWSTSGVGDLSPTERMRLTGTGNLLIGTTADVASSRFQMQADKTVTALAGAGATVWDGFNYKASTLSLTMGAGAVAVDAVSATTFAIPSITSTVGAGIPTVGIAATVTIAGPPAALPGTSLPVLTKTYALHAPSGTSYFDAANARAFGVQLTSTVAAIGLIQTDGTFMFYDTGSAHIWRVSSEVARMTSNLNFVLGSSDVASSRFRVAASKSIAVGAGLWNGIDFAASTLTLTGGAPSVVASLSYFNIVGPTITSDAADTVTDLQTMLVGVPAAPAGGAGLTFTNVWSATFAGSVKHLGRDEWNLGTTTPAATTMTLPEDGNVFQISVGTGFLDRIESLRWRAGSVIVLIFTGAVAVSSNAAAAGTALGIKLASVAASPFNTVADSTLTLVNDGAYWQEIGRKAP